MAVVVVRTHVGGLARAGQVAWSVKRQRLRLLTQGSLIWEAPRLRTIRRVIGLKSRKIGGHLTRQTTIAQRRRGFGNFFTTCACLRNDAGAICVRRLKPTMALPMTASAC